jgi:hypothetical protein
MTMTPAEQDLIPTSIRLDRATLQQVSEVTALKQTTRTTFIREALTAALEHWNRKERAMTIQRLVKPKKDS